MCSLITAKRTCLLVISLAGRCFYRKTRDRFPGACLWRSPDTWVIVEWESVRSFGDVETTTAQVWIGINSDANPAEDISFVYGADVADGDSGFLTVGAENEFGNRGGTVYFDGVGALPGPSFPNPPFFEVDVFSVPGAPGETHVISFVALGVRAGKWTNYATMTSDRFAGTSIVGFSGKVNRLRRWGKHGAL